LRTKLFTPKKKAKKEVYYFWKHHREGVDVLDCHGMHVAEMRSRDFDRSDVGKRRSHGVILETKKRLEATSKELVRDRGTCDGVQKDADVPLSGELTLIFANTLWSGAKDSVCFLRNLQSQCWSTVCEVLL
jgi:hypothetical protein